VHVYGVGIVSRFQVVPSVAVNALVMPSSVQVVLVTVSIAHTYNHRVRVPLDDDLRE
jgi:hypothetical protein